MGIDILYDKRQGIAALYDNTTDWTFDGPTASDCDVCGEDAEEILQWFLDWVRDFREVRDIRGVSVGDMFKLWHDFDNLHREHECRDCHGTGNVMAGPNEVTCGACGGAGKIGNHTHEDDAVAKATGEPF